jgi:hypothetical protein
VVTESDKGDGKSPTTDSRTGRGASIRQSVTNLFRGKKKSDADTKLLAELGAIETVTEMWGELVTVAKATWLGSEMLGDVAKEYVPRCVCVCVCVCGLAVG